MYTYVYTHVYTQHTHIYIYIYIYWVWWSGLGAWQSGLGGHPHLGGTPPGRGTSIPQGKHQSEQNNKFVKQKKRKRLFKKNLGFLLGMPIHIPWHFPVPMASPCLPKASYAACNSALHVPHDAILNRQSVMNGDEWGPGGSV